MRTLSSYADDAGRRVLAKQGALRAAQDFDLLDVERFEQLRLHMRHDEIVDEHADRRLPVNQNVRLRGGSNCKAGCVECGDLGRRKIRHQPGGVADIERKQIGEILFANCRHRDGSHLDVGAFATACCRYEDFLQLHLSAGTGLREAGCRCQKNDRCNN